MMSINFKKYLAVSLLIIAFSSILFASNAYAVTTDGSGEVFSSLTGTGWEIFGGMQKIIYSAAGMGIIAVAIGGLFGALNWKWLGAIIIGVVVISLTAGLVQYLVADTGADVSLHAIESTVIK